MTSLPAKKKTAAHKLDPEVESLVKEDEANKKLWDDAMQNLDQGSQVSRKKNMVVLGVPLPVCFLIIYCLIRISESKV